MKSLKAARMFFNEGHSMQDCVVRDISEHGAKLCLEGTTLAIPDGLLLSPSSHCRKDGANCVGLAPS
jgi:hypothetical protein